MSVMTIERAKWTPEKIRHLRKEVYRETQSVFAARLRLDGETIRKWEAGKKKPSGPATLVLDRLLELADANQLQTA